jgi:hypothetical protein
MIRNRTIQIGSFILAIVCIVSSSFLDDKIGKQKKSMTQDSTHNQQFDTSARVPTIVVAAQNWAGPIRPVIINVLWYRLQEMQQAGQYYEANSLAQALTTLLPRYPRVWDFHAWNMAYNISVTTHTPEERWDWVNKGIRMLREKAIPLNPQAVYLYEKLSFFFFHKIGKYSDEMHWYYKQQFAKEWDQVVGSLPPSLPTQEVLDAFALIANAPETYEELKKKTPEIQSLLDQLDLAGYSATKDHQRTLRALATAQAFQNATIDPLELQLISPGGQVKQFFDPKLAKILEQPANKKAIDALIPFLRHRTLVMDYKMDPKFMHYLMVDYHLPLDWRHPMSHGFYWANKGVDVAGGLKSGRNVDLLNTLRRRLHAMQSLAWQGQIIYDPVAAELDWQYTPSFEVDPRFIDAYIDAIIESRGDLDIAIKKGKYSKDSYKNFMDGHRNFIQAAVRDQWDAGNIAYAKKYFDILRDPEGDFSGKGAADVNLYDMGLEKYARHLIDSEFKRGLINVQTHITNLIRRGVLQGLMRGRVAIFVNLVRDAKRAYDEHSKKNVGLADATAIRGRADLPAFDQMLHDVMYDYMIRPNFSLNKRVRIWRNMPNQHRLAIYDRMKKAMEDRLKTQSEQLVKAGQAPGPQFDQLFPVPQGIVEYRKKQKKAIEDKLKKQPG